jgi:hypothetical protein
MYLISNKINLILTSVFIISSITAGNLNGTVSYSGKPPKKKSLKMDADPICSSAHRDKVYAESFILNEDGQLANVLVCIKNVPYDGGTPKEPAVVDQKGCIYSPHVFGIMKDQELIIKNSDPTMHNIHSMSKVNEQFNFAMPKVVKEKKVTFKKTEDPFFIKCDVHPWMKAWTTVTDHPYFAVSDSNGKYEITGIPAGTYEVDFWHEKAKGMGGVGSYKVTIGKDGDIPAVTTQDHTFIRPKKKKK